MIRAKREQIGGLSFKWRGWATVVTHGDRDSSLATWRIGRLQIDCASR